MLTLATKASLLFRWNAFAQAKGAFIVMGVGCLATLALFFFSALAGPLSFSAYWPTWLASSITISSSLLRFHLVRRGWSAVSARELKSLPSHLRGAALVAHEERSEALSEAELPAPCGLEETIQVRLLRMAQAQGFVSWAQVDRALQEQFGKASGLEWLFIGRGGEAPATPADWASSCSAAARLDAQSPTVSRETPARRL